MLIKLVFFAALTAWAVHPTQSMQSYYIISNESSMCSPDGSACFTLQQFAEVAYNESTDFYEQNVTLIFAPGEHFLTGGVELNNTASIVIAGAEKKSKPEISCKEKSCFSFCNTSSVRIENLVFTKCYSQDSDGGAIFITEAETVNITECFFLNNLVRSSGGAMKLQLIENVHMLKSQFINNSAVCSSESPCAASSGAISGLNITSFVIKDSLLDGNAASSYSGAVYLSLSNANVLNSSFTRNHVINIIDGAGGGLSVESCNVEVADSTFEKNVAGNGGGIFSLSSTILMFTNNFLFNTAGVSGGGLYVEDSDSIQLSNNKFEGNRAFNGGGVFLSSSTIEIDSNSFSLNTVGSSGGGIHIVDSDDVTVRDCTFKNNNAENGGGIFSSYSSIDIINSDFLMNTANTFFSEGGAADFQSTNVLIDNCTFSRNEGGQGGAVNIKSDYEDTTISHSTFQYNRGGLVCGGAMCIQLSGEPNCTVSCDEDVTPSDSEPVVQIFDCVFVSNNGIQTGAIDATEGVLNVTKCEFRENGGTQGGAVSCRSNIAYIHTSNFTGNTASGFGGALYVIDGIVHADQSQFLKNVVQFGEGGAINALTSTVYSKSNFYSDNEAGTTGGAISGLKSDMFCKDCKFLSNTALIGGGAAYVSEGIFCSIESIYEANSAMQNGGALYLNTTMVTIADNHFLSNSASYSSSIFQADNSIKLFNTTFTDNKASDSERMYTVQLTNVQGNCENLNFVRNTGSLYLFYSTMNFSGSIYFADNLGAAGGALSLVQSLAFFGPFSKTNITRNVATNGGGYFLFQSELKVYTSAMRIDNNAANISGGGIYGYQSQVNINIQYSLDSSIIETTNSVFLKANRAATEGGAMNAIATSLNIFSGFLTFVSIEALRGGAVALSAGSKINNLKATKEGVKELRIKLTFSNNSADYGGALYVADDTNTGVLCNQSRIQSASSQQCFIQTLGLYFLSDPNFRKLNYMNIFFSFNNGTRAGNDIFGGLLDRCQINAFSEIKNNFNRISFIDEVSGFDYLKLISRFQVGFDYNQANREFDPQVIINNITKQQLKNSISSEPVQLCFCENNSYNCSFQWPTIFAKRGETFSVQAVTVDQIENPVNGTVLTSIISDGTQLKVDQSQQLTNGICTKLVYNLFSTAGIAQFDLFPDGPCENKGISRKRLTIRFLPCNCPNGLQKAPVDNDCRCECNLNAQSYASSCQLVNGNITIVRRTENYWIQYFEHENVSGFLLQTCPYDYCVDNPVNLSISLPLNVDEQCAYNRSGIMCGECEEGLSLVFGSSRCVQCNNNYLALLVAFAFAGIALVAFILILNMTVAVGTIHGLILYANIIGANSPVFLPQETALRIFVSWVNLDLGIETCFYDGMDSYAKVLLQLVFPAYIILLSALIILVSHYSRWFSNLIGGRKNPITTLCTLFLLSYSKLLRIIISCIQFTHLAYPDGSSNILWLYNSNVPYFSLSRIPFFVISIIILALGTVYTILLFFGQWIRKVEGIKLMKCFQSDKYNAFIDAYQGPFVVKHRYWIGVLLITRIVHHVLSAILDNSTHLLIVATLMCTLLLLKQLLNEVYQNWQINFVETSYLINLLLFSVSTYYVSNTNGDQVALANTSVAIGFITFIGIVLYHTHTYFLNNLETYVKLTLTVKKHLLISKQKITRADKLAINGNTERNTSDLDTASVRMSLLREPALDIIAPVSTSDYAPPALPVANVSPPKPKPPTSTTVEINNLKWHP